jgi:Zn-dependent peptidase ImmA (M78 family)
MMIPRDDYSLMERQASEFAGCLLVPRAALLSAY